MPWVGQSLADDERFANHQARGRNQAECDAVVAEWTSGLAADDIVEQLAEAGVPAGLTYKASDMLRDEHFKAREAITRVEDPEIGPIAMQNVFPKLSASPGGVERTGPKLGEHTDAVLAEWLGYDVETIAALKAANVL
ncbi:CoA transferase [Jiella pelagia]|uniref:CoA transferase n=1 Tax=Jiella pelagia TaxID=2986949 RepID=A0ABY7C7S8_9HYPH|nr:CoA transferase [Jiella pelagia]